MTRLKHICFVLTLLSIGISKANAQEVYAEINGTASTGKYAPLWLSANKQGLLSVRPNSAYQRLGIHDKLTLSADTASPWKLSYAADVTLAQNAEHTFMIHQLYGEIEYKKLRLLAGQKENEIDMRNNSLTSGGLSQGINAHPIPKVLLDVSYFSVPYTNGWWKMRGRVGFGKTTDGDWQQRWVDHQSRQRYTSNTLYHEKAIYWKFGKEDKFPLTFEPGLQMMTQFGGTSFNATGRNHEDGAPIVHPEDFNAFWHAFWPMGSEDVTDGMHPNAAGNTVGSYNIALTWTEDDWRMRAYFERVFEDQSMLTVQYGIFDHLLGLDLKLPDNPYVSNIVVEHMSTKDQAGPVYHDATTNIPESYTGIDNYYNHHLFTGWQHWGMAIGHPLITSPLYNDDNIITFRNNRIRALHIGVDGQPSERLTWRALATFTRNWGTYAKPFDDVISQNHFMAEATYIPKFMNGCTATLALAMDTGKLIGNSFGAQLTIRKTIDLDKK